MLFRSDLWPGLADGSVKLAFRRWRRPRARSGAWQRVPTGGIEIDAVEVVEPTDVTKADAHRAGFTSRAALLAEVDKFGEGDLYRIRFHFVGADPRVGLRNRDTLSDAERAALERRLQ